jgi:hypothetical protein
MNFFIVFISGPALGFALYGVGGFMLPFVVVGLIGLAVAVALIFLIPGRVSMSHQVIFIRLAGSHKGLGAVYRYKFA